MGRRRSHERGDPAPTRTYADIYLGGAYERGIRLHSLALCAFAATACSDQGDRAGTDVAADTSCPANPAMDGADPHPDLPRHGEAHPPIPGPLRAAMLAVASSPAFSQPCSEAEEAKLCDFDKAWAKATSRRGRTRLEAIFAEDFASTDINGSQNKATTIDAAVQVAERRRAGGQTAPPTCTTTTSYRVRQSAPS